MGRGGATKGQPREGLGRRVLGVGRGGSSDRGAPLHWQSTQAFASRADEAGAKGRHRAWGWAWAGVGLGCCSPPTPTKAAGGRRGRRQPPAHGLTCARRAAAAGARRRKGPAEGTRPRTQARPAAAHPSRIPQRPAGAAEPCHTAAAAAAAGRRRSRLRAAAACRTAAAAGAACRRARRGTGEACRRGLGAGRRTGPGAGPGRRRGRQGRLPGTLAGRRPGRPGGLEPADIRTGSGRLPVFRKDTKHAKHRVTDRYRRLPREPLCYIRSYVFSTSTGAKPAPMCSCVILSASLCFSSANNEEGSFPLWGWPHR